MFCCLRIATSLDMVLSCAISCSSVTSVPIFQFSFQVTSKGFFHYQAGITSCSGLGLCTNVFIFQPFLALSETYSYCGRSVPIWIFWWYWGGSCWNLTLCSGSSLICCNSYCLSQKVSDCCLLGGNCLAMGFHLGSLSTMSSQVSCCRTLLGFGPFIGFHLAVISLKRSVR